MKQYQDIEVRFQYDMQKDLWHVIVYLPSFIVSQPQKFDWLKAAEAKPETVAINHEFVPTSKLGGTISSEALYHGGYEALGALFENSSIDHPVVTNKEIALHVCSAAKKECENNYTFLSAMTGSVFAMEKIKEESKQAMLKNAAKQNKKVNGGYDLPDIMPELLTVVRHPELGHEATIYSIIIDLNDHHRWSRERVADWLDTLDADLTFPMEDDDVE